MTGNQLKYHEIQEGKRHNLAIEGETVRHNVVSEAEVQRHNVVSENETYRSNVARETETNRHNIVDESIKREGNAITRDYNNGMLTIGFQNAKTNARNAELRELELQESNRHNKQQEIIGLRNAESQRRQSLASAVQAKVAAKQLEINKRDTETRRKQANTQRAQAISSEIRQWAFGAAEQNRKALSTFKDLAPLFLK